MKRELFSGLILTAMMFAACSDDLDNTKRFDDKLLHFKLSFNESQGQWTDGSASHTRALSTLPMTANGIEGLTLYLNCEEQDRIDEPALISEEEAATRGQRLTGEVFDNSAITTFGLYGEDEDKNEVLGDESKTFKKQLKSDYTKNDIFYEKELDLDFPGDGWPDGKNATFYGFAPFHYTGGSAEGVAKNISASYGTGGVPIITYTMQPDEADNKDVLTAKKTLNRAEKNANGIELQFRHILSAVKFKQPAGGMTCKVKDGDVDKETYYVKITKIELKNIYKSGTANLGEEFTDTDGDPKKRTSNWNYKKESGNQATCSYTLGIPTTSTDTYINTDEHCFMVLPQELSTDAYVQITCNLYADEAMSGTPKYENTTFDAPLNGQTWLPGYSYTYTINNNELTYKIESNLSTVLATAFPVDGTETTARAFTVKSYATNPAPGDQSYGFPMSWKVQYKDGTEWKDGMPDDFFLEDETGRVFSNEEMLNLPGSVKEKTYKILALRRNDGLPSVSELRTHEYGDPNATTPESYHDLSLFDVDCVTPISRNTANCYMINGYGKFKFPLVYGNAIKNGATNAEAYTEKDSYEIFVDYKGNHIAGPSVIPAGTSLDDLTADVVWMDDMNLIWPSTIHLGTEGGFYFMYFEIPKSVSKQGNAILCVKDKDKKIMWSWHIWVTTFNLSETVQASKYISTAVGTKTLDFAQRNLGWRDSEQKTYTARTISIRLQQNESSASEENTISQKGGDVILSGSNLYYQHGRKDPMPSATQIWNGSSYIDHDMTTDIALYGYTWSNVQTTTSIAYAIQTPNVFYNPSTGDWEKHDNDNYGGRWDPQKAGNTDGAASAYSLIKTVYDPCPVGFTVPPCRAFNLITGWSTTVIAADAAENKAHIPGLKFTSPDGTKTLTFYRTGNRRKATGLIEYYKEEGRYWTAGVGGYGTYLLRISGTKTVDYDYSRYRCRGIAVRPVADTRFTFDSEFKHRDGDVTPESSLVRRK